MAKNKFLFPFLGCWIHITLPNSRHTRTHIQTHSVSLFMLCSLSISKSRIFVSIHSFFNTHSQFAPAIRIERDKRCVCDLSFHYSWATYSACLGGGKEKSLQIFLQFFVFSRKPKEKKKYCRKINHNTLFLFFLCVYFVPLSLFSFYCFFHRCCCCFFLFAFFILWYVCVVR